MGKTTSYTYRPLSIFGATEIRLLKILPTPDLKFDVIHHNLNRRIDYAALSYRWGDNPVFKQVIYVEDCEFLVTDSLHDALQSLKTRQLQNNAETKSQYIWIDQICINQSDIHERSSQVPLMKMIYEQASKIIIWLGNPEKPTQTKLGFEMMEDLVNKNRQIGFKMLPIALWKLPSRQNTVENVKAKNEQFMASISITDPSIFDVEGSPTHTAWLGICDLFRNPWWGRTWVYQEATVSEHFIIDPLNSRVRFLCGDRSVTWIHVCIALRVATYLVTTRKPETKFIQDAWDACSRVNDARILRLSSTLTLLTLLRSFRHSQCQNPRDKVYAPLCLAPSDVREKLVADYTKPLRDVYIDVLKVCLSETGHELDFLGHVMKLKQPLRKPSPEADLLTWPSWVPNWDQPLPLHPIPKVLHLPGGKPKFRNGMIDLNKQQTNAYNASRGTHAEAYILDDNLRYLAVLGVRCDTIADLKPFSSRPGRTPELEEKIRQKAQRWAQGAEHQYFLTGEEWTVAMKRTEAMDVQYDSRGNICGRNFMLETLDTKLNQPGEAKASSSYESRITMTIATERSALMRNVCLTKNGYIGMVPNTAEVGDIVCALLGGQVLYTLRYPGAGDEHEYIGEAYLHGLMDGEIMEWVSNGSATVETFVLA